MTNIVLRLYVAGTSAGTERVINILKYIFTKELGKHYSLEVIDVIQNPEMAEDERIIATPTLVRVLPEPKRRVIGDLFDHESVFYGLGLKQASRDIEAGREGSHT
jgi:circadian clock protein KaiB